MSKKNLYDFLDECRNNDDLQPRISDEIDGETLVALGAEYGYEFTTEDLEVAAELTDDELDQVAGGQGLGGMGSKGFGRNLGSGLRVQKLKVRSGADNQVCKLY